MRNGRNRSERLAVADDTNLHSMSRGGTLESNLDMVDGNNLSQMLVDPLTPVVEVKEVYCRSIGILNHLPRHRRRFHQTNREDQLAMASNRSLHQKR